MGDTVKTRYERCSRAEALAGFYNNHQEKFVAAQINLAVLSKRDPDDTYAERIVAAPGMPLGQGQRARMKIKVAEGIVTQITVFNENLALLVAIEDLIAEEEPKFARLYSTKRYASIRVGGAEKPVK